MEILFPIHETFQETVQGEGYWTGALVDFIRLYGCPVGCPWCDTGYADGKPAGVTVQRKGLDDLLAELKSKRVVISGGEPFANQNLPLLVDRLIDCGHQVHIETSGAFYLAIDRCAWVTVSPKEHVNPRFPVHPLMWQRANEIKIVITNGTELDFYKDKIAGCDLVYLQPEATNFNQTLLLTLDLLKQNPELRLSLQTHKLIGVR